MQCGYETVIKCYLYNTGQSAFLYYNKHQVSLLWSMVLSANQLWKGLNWNTKSCIEPWVRKYNHIIMFQYKMRIHLTVFTWLDFDWILFHIWLTPTALDNNQVYHSVENCWLSGQVSLQNELHIGVHVRYNLWDTGLWFMKVYPQRLK